MKKKKTKVSEHKTLSVSKMKLIKVKNVNLEGCVPYKSSIDLDNPRKIRQYLTEFFETGEHEAFMDLLVVYINHIGKRKLANLTKIPERSIYNFKDKKHKTSSENIFKIMGVLNKMSA
jgi:hypothetical protein